MALYLDPRTKSWGSKVCIDTGDTKDRAVDELKWQAVSLVNIRPASSPVENPSSDSSGMPPPAKRACPRLEQIEDDEESSEDEEEEESSTHVSVRHAQLGARAGGVRYNGSGQGHEGLGCVAVLKGYKATPEDR